MRASGKCLRVVEGGVSIWVALMERTYVRNVKNRRPESCDQFQDGQTEKMRERLYLADVPELKRAELCQRRTPSVRLLHLLHLLFPES